MRASIHQAKQGDNTLFKCHLKLIFNRFQLFFKKTDLLYVCHSFGQLILPTRFICLDERKGNLQQSSYVLPFRVVF
jgi:hypothetical protein